MIALHGDVPLPAPRLPELITAVFDADDQDEADWVEWKSTLDLSSLAGLVHVSRAILGFANRDPQKSQQPFGGTAYVLVGVEPGNLNGVDPVDLATLQPKLEKYLGKPQPYWRHHYVPPTENPDLRVLVIEVPPPRAGEYPFPWRTDYQPVSKSETGASSGTLFVRRGSKTERANYEEVLMLVDRAAHGTAPRHLSELGIQVEMTSPSGPLRTVRFAEAVIDEWLERRRQVLLRPTVEDAERRLGLNRLLSDFEIRQYSRTLDAYLNDCRPLIEGVLVAELMRDGVNSVVIDIDNPSDDHLVDVEVRVTMPTWCTVVVPSRARRHVLPDPPPLPLPMIALAGAEKPSATDAGRWPTPSEGAEPPRFRASPHLVHEGVRQVYRESLNTIRARSHRHTCTLQLLIESEVDEIELRVEVTSTSFPGVVYETFVATVESPDAELIDELVDPDPAKAAQDRAPRFPPSHQH